MSGDPRDFVALIEGLRDADPRRGILLVDARFREAFHSYADLYRRAIALSRSFGAQGVAPGQRVMIPLATDIDAIASFLALVRMGAVPFSVTAPLMGQDREAHRRQMVRLIRLHRVDRLVQSDDLSGIAGAYEGVPAEIAVTVPAVGPGMAAANAVPPPVRVRPEDVAFVQFSSGSTSRPKGVPITHRGIVANIRLILDADRRTAEHTWVSWLPLYHDMGLVGGLLTNFVHKNPLVLMHPRCFITRPVAWLDAISRHRGYVTAIPNFALDMCTQRITDEQLEEHDLDLSSFRYVFNGSEPVRPASIRRFEERFRAYGFVPGSIRPVYGMAEATLIVSAPRFEEGEVVRRIEGMDVPSVGYPLGDFEARIRDEEGEDLPADAIGEIHLRGSCLTPGYLDPEGTSSDLIRDGWLATGDLGMLDTEGRLYVTGRKKDLLIFQGRNFYGHDIAAFVVGRAGLRSGSVHVFAAPEEEGERVVVMLALPKPGPDRPAPRDPEALEREVRLSVLREFGLAVHDVVTVPRIPKTTSGKVMRHLCLQMYRESRG